MIRNGLASALWGRYTGIPELPNKKTTNHLRLVSSPKTRVDPMCDYIEGAEWWLARSDSSVRMLQKLFEQQEVACLLYEKSGAIVELGRVGAQYKIAIQLVRDKKEINNWDLDLSLSDSGIYLEEVYKPV